MSEWTIDELNKIKTAVELQIAPSRHDGTLRKPVPIWVVRVGDDLYIRSYLGPNGCEPPPPWPQPQHGRGYGDGNG